MPALIWFDDALKTTFDNAFPLMRERNLVGTESVPTSLVGTIWPDEEWRDKQIMTKEELSGLVSAGWEITSHSSTHPHWLHLSREEAERELLQSRTWIKDNLGIKTYCFTYPFGEVQHEDLVHKYYPLARTVNRGYWSGRSRLIDCAFLGPDDFPEVGSLIEKARSPDAFVVFLFHGIIENGDQWEIPPKRFAEFLDQIVASEVEVVSLRTAILRQCPILQRLPFGPRWQNCAASFVATRLKG